MSVDLLRLSSQVNLGRAARTDAGVHAAGNVVSIKMITAVPGIPDIVSRINEELPPEIRLWGFVCIKNKTSRKIIWLMGYRLLLDRCGCRTLSTPVCSSSHKYRLPLFTVLLISSTDLVIVASTLIYYQLTCSFLQNLEAVSTGLYRTVQRPHLVASLCLIIQPTPFGPTGTWYSLQEKTT
jgi:hypothetical protein